MFIVGKKVGQDPEIRIVPEITHALIREAIGGGYLEAMEFGAGVTCWLDEEGMLKQLPGNFPILFAPGSMLGAGQVICGDVLFTGGPDPDGETLGLTPVQLVAVMDYFVRLRPDWAENVPASWYEPQIVVVGF